MPEDISVVGVDDIPMSALTTPGADQRRDPAGQLGRAGVDMLLSLVRDPSTPPEHHHDLTFRLVVRESSRGPCPSQPRPTGSHRQTAQHGPAPLRHRRQTREKTAPMRARSSPVPGGRIMAVGLIVRTGCAAPELRHAPPPAAPAPADGARSPIPLPSP